MRSTVRRALEVALGVVVATLMGSLAMLVVVGVAFRKAGAALVWYDEVASVLLAWLTFYGASLAALQRCHIGFPKLVDALQYQWRTVALVAREVVVIAFFMMVAWAGWRVMLVLEGSFLVSLPWVPRQLAQSVIPIGAVLFIVAELLSVSTVRAGAAQGDIP